MQSFEYKRIIATIIRNILRKHYPGLKLKGIDGDANNPCYEAARAIHARMYGANIDGVDSPIWSIDQHGTDRIRDPRTKPNVDANELLKQE